MAMHHKTNATVCWLPLLCETPKLKRASPLNHETLRMLGPRQLLTYLFYSLFLILAALLAHYLSAAWKGMNMHTLEEKKKPHWNHKLFLPDKAIYQSSSSQTSHGVHQAHGGYQQPLRLQITIGKKNKKGDIEPLPGITVHPGMSCKGAKTLVWLLDQLLCSTFLPQTQTMSCQPLFATIFLCTQELIGPLAGKFAHSRPWFPGILQKTKTGWQRTTKQLQMRCFHSLNLAE